MELYYLLVQRSLWTIQLLIVFLISAEGRHSHRRILGRRQLRIGRTPEILPDPHNITVHRNEDVVLKCRVRHRGTKSVQWNLKDSSHPLTIGDLLWTSDKDFSVRHKKHSRTLESWDLLIKNAQPKHSNTYECQISSIITHRRHVRLVVLATIRKISPGITLQGKAVLDSLETLSLTCNATGSERAPGGVDWFHDGIIIRPHDERWKGRLQIYNKKSETSFRSLISQLVIEKSKLEDHGSYICRSSDRETKSIVVSILEDGNPPSRPARNKELSANPNTAALSTKNFLVFIIAFLVSTR